ncbi:hypothetical protein ACFC26_01670 [Kitasatospora purpeofusca]|uniref:hypothetical protein n=1 Tax=Kitasatospora purpeofusca TaxID=67352 RepID=UPI0035E38BF5
MTFGMRGIPVRRLAATLGAAVALVAVATGAASARTTDYRVYGGHYGTYAQCNQAGSLSIALGLYSRFECNPNNLGTSFDLWYVE